MLIKAKAPIVAVAVILGAMAFITEQPEVNYDSGLAFDIEMEHVPDQTDDLVQRWIDSYSESEHESQWLYENWMYWRWSNEATNRNRR